MYAMFYIINPIYQRKKAVQVVAVWLDREYIPSPTVFTKDVTFAALPTTHIRNVVLPLKILVRKGEKIRAFQHLSIAGS